MDPNIALLESAPESQRWDPVYGSTGHKVPEACSEDEDGEGRSDSARLCWLRIVGEAAETRFIGSGNGLRRAREERVRGSTYAHIGVEAGYAA